MEIPCIDCITLPICKSIALKPFWDGNKNVVLISELCKKCELIKEYVDLIMCDISRFRIKNLHAFFKTSYVTNKRLKNGR